jgi:pimeloyl-ACP methyl ester carboxylesterase
MHCLKAGSGPELILLHGLLGTASTWEPAMPMLARQSTLYAPDAFGIGESDRVPGMDASLEAQADRVVRFMDQSGIASADFLATSHGGTVALTLAAKHPDRVRTLMLHAPANPFCRLGDPLINFYLSSLGKWFAHRVPSLPERMQAVALGRMYGDPSNVRPGSLQKYIHSLRVPGTVAHVLRMLKTWHHDMATLEQLLSGLREVPALLIWGDRDRAVSLASLKKLQCFFKNQVDVVVLEGTGHLPFEECPETLARVVNAFLTRMRDYREAVPVLVRTATLS